jgi:hypothetical protein
MLTIANLGTRIWERDSGNDRYLSDVLPVVRGIGMEKIMTRSARIGLAAALLLGGVTFALAQNGPATGAYPPGTKNPNLYGYYGYYARPRYALGTPYYVLGYPVPHYGYRPWHGWRW